MRIFVRRGKEVHLGLFHELLVDGTVTRVNLLLFKAEQNLASPAHDVIGKPRHFGYMDAVARITGASENLVQEHELVAFFLDGHLEISRMFQAVDKPGQFMVVRREQRDCCTGRFVVQSFHNRPGNR